ncbi:hypothetical protein AAVH_32873, partial [Aphelenchoides avenae]
HRQYESILMRDAADLAGTKLFLVSKPSLYQVVICQIKADTLVFEDAAFLEFLKTSCEISRSSK